MFIPQQYSYQYKAPGFRKQEKKQISNEQQLNESLSNHHESIITTNNNPGKSDKNKK